MKRQNYLKSILCLLLGLVCHVAWAQTGTDGPLVTFTNVQQNGTTYTLYINDQGTLATSSSTAAELGDAAKFRATLQANGKYTFYNEAKKLYMIWRGGSSGGYNSNKGVLAEYNATYCDWSVNSGNNTKAGTFYIVGKRSNGTTDGALIVLSGGSFDAWGNSIAWSGNYSNLYNIESDEYTATLTDSEGTVLTCSTTGFPAPTYSNATLSDMVWKGGNLTATVSVALPVLAFPVSSAEETNATLVSSFINGGGSYTGAGRFKWYADGSDVKVQRDATITQANVASYSWAIYATLENGAFNYTIKNIATGKYIYTTASFSNSSGAHSQGTLSLSDTPTKFLCSTDGNNRFYYVSNNVNQYLSHNSVDDATGYLGVYASAHNGTTNSFHTPTYSLTDKEGFVNGGIYTFVTARGWMGATESCSNVISTVKASHNVTGAADNAMFQWTVYKSNNGNYYLYNIGKQKFMGVQSSNNQSVPFAEIPQGKKLTFKTSNSTDYPFMFSTDNAGVVNHSGDYGDGLITWTGGWDNLNDNGSNHKVTLVGTLTADELKSIADLVEAYDKRFYAKAEVDNANTPNTHFGSVRAANASGEILTKLKKGMGVVAVDYDGTQTTTIDFTRAYRGFEFQGYYLGEEELGKNFELTEELENSITEENPVVAKFTATDEVTLFYDDDLKSYRIPAIATTGTGRIIAVSDYRHNLDDIGRDNHSTGTKRIDLVARTSDDNGKTWSDTMIIAAGDDSKTGSYLRAFGDAAIAAVGENIVVMAAAGDVVYSGASAANPNRMARIFSSDNGATWTHEEITTKMYNAESSLVPSGVAAFFGSGLLAVDTEFVGTPAKPRIYGALLVRTCIDGSYNNYNNFAVYSDDLGENWAILGGSTTPVASGDEPKVEILPNGQILLSARRVGGRVFNVFTYGTGENDKANGVGSWNDSAVNGCNNGGSNGTNGEILCIDAKKADGTAVKLLLQSQPKGGSGQYDRKDVTIWYKEVSANSTYDASSIASNWTEGLQVSTQQSSYSTMTLQKDGKIGFFFEEAPCYGDDYTKGYSMVYIPLTINQITNSYYFAPGDDLTTERTINVVLTDAEGNEYHDQVTCAINGVSDALATTYSYITLGDNASIEFDGSAYTYTNTVTLPFKVSNEETTVWHNIYWHGNNNNELVYLYGGASNDQYVAKVAPGSNIPYGNSDYNTAVKADNMSWAIYHAGNFTFTLKNKLTGKFVQVTSVANGNSQNAEFVADNATATAFEIVTEETGQNYKGDYSLKATVNVTVGYLCNTSASYGWATHFNRNNHQGGWATIVEAPDFEALIAEVNEVLSMFGDGLGQYTGVSDENLAAVNAAKVAMESASSVKLNTLTEYQGYTSKTSGCTLNMPQAGQFFRIRGISGNYIDATSIYGNASATNSQMSMKSADACNYNGTVFYLDEENHLLCYATGTYVKQTREIGAVGDTDKGTWTFAESPRTGQGKYALRCTVGGTGNGTCLHDSDGNRADRCSSNCGVRHDFALEEVTSLPFTIAAVGYGTLYAPVALRIPEGIKAYTGTLSEGNTLLELTKVTSGVIPENTGVVLYRDPEGVAASSSATTHNFEVVADSETELASCFAGDVATIANSGTPYTLQMHDFNGDGTKEGIAFKRYTGANLTGFKAYLNMPSSNAAALRIRFVGEATGIETTVNSGQTTVIYDLMGRRVETMTKGGIYIVNGKKVIF